MSHLHHKVSALVDGELVGSTRTRAIAHLYECAVCRSEVEQTLLLKQRLRGLDDVEPSGDLFVRLAALPDRSGVPHASAQVSTPSSTQLGDAAATPRVAPTRLPVRLLVGVTSVSTLVLVVAYVVGAPAAVTTPTVAPPVDEFRADFAEATGAAPLADPAVEGADVRGVDPSSNAFPPADALTSVSTGADLSAVLATLPVRVDGTERPAAEDDVEAVSRLRAAVTAPERLAYSGIRHVVDLTRAGSGGLATTRSVHVAVTHLPEQGTSFDVLNGPADTTAAFVARGEDGSSPLGPERLTLLGRAYDLTLTGVAVVAGRPVTVVSASRDGEIAARFFVDDRTGLLLRREMYEGGVLVRISAFASVQVSGRGFLAHLPPELAAPVATTVSVQQALASDEGYVCPQQLSDTFELTELQRLGQSGDGVRATYADGLSTAVVYEQQGRLDSSAVAGWQRVRVDGGTVTETGHGASDEMGRGAVAVRDGLPMVAVWESGGTVYTFVTDAPMQTATSLMSALPHGSEADQTGSGESSTSSRIVRGLARLGTFVAPGV